MAETLQVRRPRKSERRRQILLELKLQPHVRIADLAERFSVTTETVRRDIEELSREGLLRRAHGGATVPHPGGYGDLDERRRQRIAERERLGRFAASLVSDGETLMIDAGSTTMEFARHLAIAETRLVAITNSLQVAMTLGQSSAARVILAPGRYLSQEAAVIGTETVAFLSRYNVDACFIGASGLSEQGVSEAVEGFDAVKRAMMRQSASRRFLVDASKFGRTHLAVVAAMNEIGTLVTDHPPPSPLADRLRREGVRVLTPEDAA